MKKVHFLAIGERWRIFVSCILHVSAKMCLYQTFGRRSPRITGRYVNTATRGWVGAPNERVPFRFHGAVVVFVDRCLSRTRNLAASNQHLAEFFLRPILAQPLPRNYFFRFFFRRFGIYIFKIRAHSERYRNLMACIFEMQTLFGNIAFPLSSVLVGLLF